MKVSARCRIALIRSEAPSGSTKAQEAGVARRGHRRAQVRAAEHARAAGQRQGRDQRAGGDVRDREVRAGRRRSATRPLPPAAAAAARRCRARKGSCARPWRPGSRRAAPSVNADSSTAGAMIGSVAARLGSCQTRASTGASSPSASAMTPETATARRIPVPSARRASASSPAARWAAMKRCSPPTPPAVPARVSTSTDRHAGLVGAERRDPEQPRDQDVRDGRQALPDRRQQLQHAAARGMPRVAGLLLHA